MSALDKMVRPRAALALRLGDRWKVTARYRLELDDGSTVRCVRVRCGAGPSFRFTATRFDELFEPVPEAVGHYE